MIKIRRRRAIASTLAVGTAATGLLALAQAPAQAAACSATKSSTVHLHGIANESEFLTHYTESGQVVIDPRYYTWKNGKTGSVSVTIMACKNPTTGKWSALTWSTSTDLKDLELRISGTKVTPVPVRKDSDRGFGTMVRRVTGNRVEFEPLMCRKEPTKASVLGVAKFVTSLPIPVSPTKAVGLYAVNNALPERDGTYSCGLLGAVTAVPYKFSSTGVASLVMPSTNHYLFNRRATWTEVCPHDRYCGVSHDQTLEVKAGKG